MTRKITVDEISRVEGHGKIQVEISDGKITELKLNIYEGPRFFEALAVGRMFDEIPVIMCRICAICSADHKITSIMALEDALGVNVSLQTQLLRELYYQGAIIESHALHLYFLALPDFLGFGSAAELVPQYPEEVKRGLKLKKLGNTIQELLAGRPIHGENPVIGGFSKIPTEEQLQHLKPLLKNALEDGEKTVLLFARLEYPEWIKISNIFYALEPWGEHYGYFGNKILSSRGDKIPVGSYPKLCNEMVVAHSTAKHSQGDETPFMVGALARINLFHEKLMPRAKKLVKNIGWNLPSQNILHNNLAQAIEIIDSLERASQIIDELLSRGLKTETLPAINVKKGRGVAATEAPRGTLYHEYELDENGVVVGANVITPTAQNLAHIERDLRIAVMNLMHLDEEQIRNRLEMVARAYDPCISCAAHLVELKVNRD